MKEEARLTSIIESIKSKLQLPAPTYKLCSQRNSLQLELVNKEIIIKNKIQLSKLEQWCSRDIKHVVEYSSIDGCFYIRTDKVISNIKERSYDDLVSLWLDANKKKNWGRVVLSKKIKRWIHAYKIVDIWLDAIEANAFSNDNTNKENYFIKKFFAKQFENLAND
jgi:hypothetical protein